MVIRISPFHRAAPLTSRSAVSVLVFAVATGLWACDEPQPTGVRGLHHSNIDDLFDGAARTIGLELGLEPSADSLRVFGRIRDATFVGRDHIAVLDRSPPFLRIFDRRGKIVAAYLPEGRGPGEARMPYALSGNDSGQVVVLHDRRVSLFHLGAGFIDSFRLEHTAQDIGRGCSGWTIYGPGPWNDSGERPWTRTVRLEPGEMRIDHEGLYDPARPRILSHMAGPVAVGRGDWVLFVAAPPRRVLPACAADSGSALPDRVLADIENVLHRSAEDFQQMVLRAWSTNPQGFTILDSEVLLSASVFAPGFELNSLLVLFTAKGPFAGSSQRHLSLRDVSGDGEILFTFGEPVPHVLVLPAERVIDRLRSLQADS